MAQKNGTTRVHRSSNHETKYTLRQFTDGKGLPLFTLALFVLFVVYQTLVTNRSVIWRLHEQSLFLADLDYLRECLSKVGGLTVYVGSFFNDFFYIPWLGTLIYTTLLLLVTWITVKAFRLKGWLFPLAMIPSLLLLLMLTQNGYMIFWIKLKGFSYVAILGILVTITGALLGSTSRKPLIQSLLAVLYILVAYPIAGVYGVMGTFLFAVFSLKHLIREKKIVHVIPAGVALLAILLVPRVYDEWVYQATHQQPLYLSNLPDYWNTENEHYLWLPYILVAGCLVLFAFLPKKTPTVPSFFRLLPFVLFLTTLLFVDKKTYKDDNFKTEMSMMEASEKGDWNQVLHLSQEVKDEPTQLIVMYTHLALFKLDKLGNEMYHYCTGNKKRKIPVVTMTRTTKLMHT